MAVGFVRSRARISGAGSRPSFDDRCDFRPRSIANRQSQSSNPMTIILGGYIVGYPLGGMSWHHLNYVLGLAELGHDVWFYEFGAWPPYNPSTKCSAWDESYGVAYIDAQFKAYGLPPKWCYEFPDGRTFNLS